MKIAVWHNLPSGGGKRALYYHVRGLVLRGHQVECWCLDSADQSYLPLTEFALEYVIPFEQDLQPRPPDGSWDDSYSYTVERMRAYDDACKRCADEIEARNFDVVFVNSALPYHMPYIMQHLSMPNVLYLQEPNRFLYEALPVLPWVANAYEDLNRAKLSRQDFLAEYPLLQILRAQAKQEWLNAQACDDILVNSYFSLESIARAYGVDAKVCYLGIDTALFRNLNMEREGFVVGLGSCDVIKRVELAVRALSLIQPSPPLVWISNSVDEDYRLKVSELAESLGVDLEFKYRISDDELVSTLNRASLLLYTSRLEPFGFAPLEGNACGLPVVAIAEGGVRETVRDGENGFLVNAEPASIARRVDWLLKNPQLAREMGNKAALEVRQTWSIEGSIDRLEGFLCAAAARDRRAPRPNNESRSSNSSNKHQPNGQESSPQSSQAEAVNGGKPARVGTAICTIIAKNYLAFARTLALSFLSIHPESKCLVLVVDDFEGYINPDEECFEIVRLADLDIPRTASLCFQYDLKELCTAVKADLLTYLITKKSIDRLLYLDPDILVTGSCDGLFERLKQNDIVLTPHLDTDYPADDLLPDDGWILRAGLFNLGFIGVNSSVNAQAFLDWWKSKLHKNCVVDIQNGYFVDQKFIDFVPIYFRDVYVEKAVGYNVAYWNVHSRELSKPDGKWLCNFEPLCFFHFSGFPTTETDALSVYISNERSRYTLANRPDLAEIFLHYEGLLNANGLDQTLAWPYSYSHFNSGQEITGEARTYYREKIAICPPCENPFESPELELIAYQPLQKPPPSAKKNPLTLEVDPGPFASPDSELTLAKSQLDAILNTTAWRWASRYGRFKHRFLLPAVKLVTRTFGSSNGHLD
jgi:glycosyltransferase involved in cell wall biosynthesis